MEGPFQIKVRFLEHFDKSFPLPRYETQGASGADIRASLPLESRQRGLVIGPGQRVLIPTGLCLEIPKGFEIQVRPRSGVSLKTNLLVPNSPGTIDSDYRGELKILMGNFGKSPEHIAHGSRLAQLVLSPVFQATFLEGKLRETERGVGGFGSTGQL